ncbi:MAG: hypothetical protein LC685_01900 [Actinobacteria bacterium]|nr:hypothetical protein [Actinomycetota bacterium]
MVAGVLIAGSVGVTACGTTEKAVVILNTEKVERAIEGSILTQRHKHAQVSCPAGVHQKRGLVFACMAATKNTKTRFVVTQIDKFGRVQYKAS